MTRPAVPPAVADAIEAYRAAMAAAKQRPPATRTKKTKIPRCRVSDRELDRRLHDAAAALLEVECPALAAAVREAHGRLFPLHCARCGELPHDGRACRRPT